MMNIKDFFEPIKDNGKVVLLSCNMNDVPSIIDNVVNFFFEKTIIFSYFKALEESDVFEPSVENYVSLYKYLEYFIDEDYIGTRKDKIGKIGEYFLSIILLHYYKFDCIIPKLIYVTDNNMPVYGIDTLFYSPDRDLLMFGEAKFTDNVLNGINLINESLSKYEEQFEDEYRLISNNSLFQKSKSKFIQDFSGPCDKATSFKIFIRKANIKTLGVPLFICHGQETKPCDIFDIFDNNLHKREIISGIAIKYIIISLPILDKNAFVSILKQRLIEKRKEYERLSR